MDNGFKIMMWMLSALTFFIGVYLLWGEWRILAGVFFMMFGNNISMAMRSGKME